MRYGMAFSLLFLTSCGEAPPIYPDHCSQTGLTYTDSEKIDATLRFLASNFDNPYLTYYKNVEFFKFIKPGQSDQEISEAIMRYRSQFPDCCHVLKPPTYVEWYSGMRSHGFSEREIIGEPGDWVADVSIENRWANREKQDEPFPDFKVSSCNKSGILPRG
jgi:hypothetical protein